MFPLNQRSRFYAFIPWLAVGLITLATGLYIRSYPILSHMWSDNNEKAAVIVVAQVKEMITRQVNQRFPQMPDDQKKALIQKQFNQTLKSDKAQMQSTIERVKNQLSEKSSSDINGQYLLASDSYYFYALTQNVLQTGRMAEIFKGGKHLNPLMTAPLGGWEPINLHPYVGALTYLAIKIFKPDTQLMGALGFTPFLLTGIILIFYLLICRRLNVRPLAAFIGGHFFVLAPIFVKRSAYGWYDTDPYNLLFPLAILFFFIKGFSELSNRKATLINAGICALLLALYSLFWPGWPLIVGIIFISAFSIMFAQFFIIKKHPFKKLISFPAYLLLFVVAGLMMIFGPSALLFLLKESFGELLKFTGQSISEWPSLFIGVGELKKSSLGDIIEQTGGLLFTGLGLLGLATSLVKSIRQKNTALLNATTALCVFMFICTIITLGAQRFILFCLIPIAIFTPVFIDHLFGWIEKKTVDKLARPARLGVLIILTSILVYVPYQSSKHEIKTLLNPIFNETWESALTKIKNQTPEDSIINSWWPPGHFIKSIAHRRVSFDGASLSNNVQAYWTARALLSENENLAAAYLRMINNSASKAQDHLTSLGWKASRSINFLEQLAGLSREQAYQYASNQMSPDSTAELIKLTHASPSPAYFLYYNEMMDKHIGIEFIGKWNFKAIEDINENPAALKNFPPSNSRKYIEKLWQLMGGAYKVSETLNFITQQNSQLYFEHNLVVDQTAMEASLQSPKYGTGNIRSIIYLKDGTVKEALHPDPSLNISLVLYQENGRYYATLMDRPLARSLLVKLHYFNGAGLKIFEKIIHESNLTGRTDLQVFRINWDKLEAYSK